MRSKASLRNSNQDSIVITCEILFLVIWAKTNRLCVFFTWCIGCFRGQAHTAQSQQKVVIKRINLYNVRKQLQRYQYDDLRSPRRWQSVVKGPWQFSFRKLRLVSESIAPNFVKHRYEQNPGRSWCKMSREMSRESVCGCWYIYLRCWIWIVINRVSREEGIRLGKFSYNSLRDFFMAM